MKDYIVIFASTSGIANAVAEEFLKRKVNLILCARNRENLERQVNDLEIKWETNIPFFVWDLHDLENHRQYTEQLFEKYRIRGLFMAAGMMPECEQCEKDEHVLLETMQLNLTSVMIVIQMFAKMFSDQQSGFISCLSSVAGDRGKQSNYIYGASKSGLSTYLQGLRNRLYQKGIFVQTVKPGIVYTPMTEHLSKSVLMAQPEHVARDIVNGIEKKVDVLYTPFFWKYIMSAISLIPERLFKRLSL